MKAAVVHDPAEGPRYGSFELPLKEGDMVLDVLAAGLSPRVRSGASGSHYTSSGSFPLVPGIDGVGRSPDGRRFYFLGGSEVAGTMAEKAIADPRGMIPLPENVRSSTIAAGMLPAISSWVALTKRAPIQPGQHVLVLGATGVAGLLAVQIAKRLGAGRVVAAGRDADALERTRMLGADEAVALTGDGTDGEKVAQAASEVDIVLDYLWGSVTSLVMPALCRHRQAGSRALHWVLIGSVTGDAIALSSVLLRKRNLHILGSGQGATSNADLFGAATDVAAAFAAGQLDVRVREVPLAEVATWWAATPASGERIVFVP
ncbi:MAG: zinc-binding alcohol dehydrogenase family protein [Flavobacteriales bacterium]